MADHFTQFACMFDVGSADNATAALALLDKLRSDPADDEPPYGFDAEIDSERPGFLWTGGGAQLIDLGARKSLAWLDCEHWLQGALDPDVDADTDVAQSALAGGEPAVGPGQPIGDDGQTGIATLSVPAD